jgi:signal transduction histidine kinase/CheY-like chemotaxis protein/HAMP domain-containing protein
MNIRTKLILLGLGCIFATAIAMVGVGIWQGNKFSVRAKNEATRLVNADLDHIIASVYNLVATQDESIQQEINHDLTVAQYLLNSFGQISLSSETVSWVAVNQATQTETHLDIPKMLVKKQWLGQNRLMWIETPVVDLIKRLVGGTATIFQRISDQGDMLRVATNVEQKDGTRAIGTYIPAINSDGTKNPVVDKVMHGENFRGISYVVNAWYVTAYEPLYGPEGKVIGALCVGVKQDSIKALRDAIEKIVIGQTGYVFVLGGRGADQGHYIISKNGQRDGEDLNEIADAEGHKFIQSIVAKAIDCKPGEFVTERYPWQNPGENAPRWKIAHLAYYEPWDWVIGATAYEDEINQSIALFSRGYQDMIRVFGFVAIVVAIIAGIITWLFARRLSDALLVVTRAATKLTEHDLPLMVDTMEKVNAGDLNVTVHFNQNAVEVTSEDELGTLAAAFTRMNAVLVGVGMAFTKMVASLRDLTGQLEERVAERTAELAQSKRKMADIIDFLPDATLVIDQKGQVIAWNLAMEKLTGIPSSHILGKGDYEYGTPFYGRRRPILIDQVLHPKPDHEENYQGFRREGNTLYGETRSVHLKQEEVYLFAAASALFDADGNKVGAIETLRDITGWKKIEKELIAAKLTAEEATKARSDFLANMSHEIRTPMNGVIGMTSLLLQTELTDEQSEYARTVQSSAETLLTIINDILDFSKIEAGKLDFENIDFDLRFALDEITEMLSVKAEEKQLEFVGFVQPNVPSRLQGDPGRLRQVLLNLASNAIKFTSAGEVVIEVELIDENQDQAKLRFSVKDTGIGIPADRLNCLFKSFSQVDSSTTRKFGGTGLGLAITKRLIGMMNGDIGVESKEGRGSNFWFTVKMNKQPNTDDSHTRAIMPEELRGKRILAVDDNATNRKIIKSYLKSWQCRATVAPDAEQAMALLTLAAENDTPFEMAIIDFMMPGMDGEALGRAIKSNPVLKETHLIMLTSRGMRGDAARARSMGFEGYLTKPIKQSPLFNAILTVFGKKLDKKRPQDHSIVTIHSIAEAGKRKLQILLTEDNAVNQKVALIHLRKFGFSVDVAENGKEAVEAVRKRCYDLILMDIQMPEMDGHEATRTIRREGYDLPIIAMTANAMKGDREKCLDAGMNDYLAKPVNPKELLAKIEHWSAHSENATDDPSSRLN